MIFSGHANACVRVGSAVPPLLLLAGILFIWVRYNFGLALPLLFDRVTHNGTLYALSVSGFICMALSAVLANASSFVLLLSFWRAVTLPAGAVPTWYVRRHRAAVAWFRNQFQRHSDEPTPATAVTAGGPVRTASAKRVRWADAGGAGPEPTPDVMTAADTQDPKLPAPYQRSGATLLGLPASTPLAAARLSRALAAASAEASPPAATGGASAVVGGADAHLAPSERLPWAAPPPALRGAIGRDGGYRPGPHDMRWCRTCQSLKPPRSHHCSVCRTCVLKMDHHCPWVGNCVGYNNYKPFYLLLLWGCVALLFAYAAWLPIALGWWLPLQPSAPAAVVSGAGSAATPRSAEVVEGTGQWKGGRVHQLDAAAEPSRSLLRGVALAGRRVALVDRWPVEPPLSARFLSDQVAVNSRFAFGGGGFAQTMGFVGGCSLFCSLALLCGLHTVLILRGMTTLEAGDDGPRPYNWGAARNWALVMGRDPRLWLWPDCTTDVRAATAGGTSFRGYIGDATYSARLRLYEELAARERRGGGGLGSSVADEDEEEEERGAAAEPAAGAEEGDAMLVP